MEAAQTHPLTGAGTPAAKIAMAVPTFIVLGRDESGKAHASRFGATEREAAARAADVMGMHGLPVDDESLALIARRLPRGKVFASGKAFMPFVKGSTFDQLATRLPMSALAKPVRAAAALKGDGADGKESHDGTPSATFGPKGGSAGSNASGTDNSSNDDQGGARGAPRDWGSLAAGDTVLAMEGPEESWWEAVVVEKREGKLVLLRWRDFKGTPTFARRRGECVDVAIKVGGKAR